MMKGKAVNTNFFLYLPKCLHAQDASRTRVVKSNPVTVADNNRNTTPGLQYTIIKLHYLHNYYKRYHILLPCIQNMYTGICLNWQ